jgi:dipeptidyl-peptidase-4
MKKVSKIMLAAALLLSSASLYAQKTYDELSQITRLNRGVYGLQSMNDGEHYTVSKGGAVIRHAYADESKCDTLYRGRFASYEFSPNEDMIILGNNFREVYRHSAYADYSIVRLADKESVAELKNVRDLNLSPDSKWVAYAQDNNLFVAELGKPAKAITTDGEWNKIINGTADWVYEEEYGFKKD